MLLPQNLTWQTWQPHPQLTDPVQQLTGNPGLGNARPGPHAPRRFGPPFPQDFVCNPQFLNSRSIAGLPLGRWVKQTDCGLTGSSLVDAQWMKFHCMLCCVRASIVIGFDASRRASLLPWQDFVTAQKLSFVMLCFSRFGIRESILMHLQGMYIGRIRTCQAEEVGCPSQRPTLWHTRLLML